MRRPYIPFHFTEIIFPLVALDSSSSVTHSDGANTKVFVLDNESTGKQWCDASVVHVL